MSLFLFFVVSEKQSRDMLTSAERALSHASVTCVCFVYDMNVRTRAPPEILVSLTSPGRWKSYLLSRLFFFVHAHRE